MRIAQLVVVPVAGVELVEVDELPASERGVARLRLVGAADGRPSPASASRRSSAGSGRILLCRHEKAGRRVLAAAGRRRRTRARASCEALHRELARGGRAIERRDPGRGAGRDRRLDRAGAQLRGEARRPHHLRRPTSTGRSLEAVTSRTRRCAATGCSTLGELDEIVLHPPIQRFLGRWRPGDPVVLSRAALGPVGPLSGSEDDTGAIPARARRRHATPSPLGSKAAGGQRWPTRPRVY